MKESNKIVWAAYLYLLLPVCIFIGTWLKIVWAVPFLILICISAYYMFKNAPKLWVPSVQKKEIGLILAIIAIAIVWVIFSGVGRLVYQNDDHAYRNAIYEMLVQYKWPVIFDNKVAGEKVGLIYYIGFWLPAAAVGKIFGLQIGYYFQVLWASFGIILVFYLLLVCFKKIKIWPLLGFIFFSGLDVLGYVLACKGQFSLFTTDHMEWWAISMQYSSNTTQLFNVFNQCIVAWLITLLMLQQKNNKSIVMLFGCSLLFCTFPAVGMIPILIYIVFRNSPIKRKDSFILFLKNVITFENVVGGGVIGITTFLYLKGNKSGGVFYVQNPKNVILTYLLFIIFEFVIYMFFVYRYYWMNPLYYIVFGVLLIFPVINIGNGGDFCMRASIPALTVVALMTLKTLEKDITEKHWIRAVVLSFILLIGSITPIHEFNRTISNTFQSEIMGQIPYTYSIDLTECEVNNFSGTLSESFFFQYMAR